MTLAQYPSDSHRSTSRPHRHLRGRLHHLSYSENLSRPHRWPHDQWLWRSWYDWRSTPHRQHTGATEVSAEIPR